MSIDQRSIQLSGTRLFERNGAWIAENTILGKNITILPGAIIGRPPISTNALRRKSTSVELPPVIIGDDCIVGACAIIYGGVRIGTNCLIGDTACIREHVEIGDSCLIAMGVTVNYNSKIGSRVKIMDNTHITGNMTIEDDVFISMLVTSANDNSMGRNTKKGEKYTQNLHKGPIVRQFVTIGQGSCLSPGVEIGKNTIVGANSVVTHSLPERVLALGIPARVVRQLRDDEIIAN